MAKTILNGGMNMTEPKPKNMNRVKVSKQR